jgi:hypothetical protein
VQAENEKLKQDLIDAEAEAAQGRKLDETSSGCCSML